jgi:hypothetical protein
VPALGGGSASREVCCHPPPLLTPVPLVVPVPAPVFVLVTVLCVGPPSLPLAVPVPALGRGVVVVELPLGLECELPLGLEYELPLGDDMLPAPDDEPLPPEYELDGGGLAGAGGDVVGAEATVAGPDEAVAGAVVGAATAGEDDALEGAGTTGRTGTGRCRVRRLLRTFGDEASKALDGAASAARGRAAASTECALPPFSRDTT